MTLHRSILSFPLLIVGCLVLAAQAMAAQDMTANGDSASHGQPLENTVTWTTASEINSYGYDVYRGEKETGPFVKLTESPLPGAGTSDTPQSYKFVDDTIEPGTVYYYYVESVSMDGIREQMTPVFPSKPKYPE